MLLWAGTHLSRNSCNLVMRGWWYFYHRNCDIWFAKSIIWTRWWQWWHLALMMTMMTFDYNDDSGDICLLGFPWWHLWRQLKSHFWRQWSWLSWPHWQLMTWTIDVIDDESEKFWWPWTFTSSCEPGGPSPVNAGGCVWPNGPRSAPLQPTQLSVLSARRIASNPCQVYMGAKADLFIYNPTSQPTNQPTNRRTKNSVF